MRQPSRPLRRPVSGQLAAGTRWRSGGSPRLICAPTIGPSSSPGRVSGHQILEMCGSRNDEGAPKPAVCGPPGV
jgi:hypothetical protein